MLGRSLYVSVSAKKNGNCFLLQDARIFIGVMDKYDPSGLFMNSFGHRIKRTGTKIDANPLGRKRCALMDICICSKDLDCASTQTCTKLKGYTYRVCKTKNEMPEIVFDKSLLPPPLGVVSYLVSDVPTLLTSVIANCSLADVSGTVGLLLSGKVPIENVLQSAEVLGKQLGKLRSLAEATRVVHDVLGGILSRW